MTMDDSNDHGFQDIAMGDVTIKIYTRAIYEAGGERGFARTSDVAERLGNSLSTVTETFQKMSNAGLVEYIPYKGVRLAERGREIAEGIMMCRRTITRFLLHVGVPRELVDMECEVLELVMSEGTLTYLDDLLDGGRIGIDTVEERDRTGEDPSGTKAGQLEVPSNVPGERGVPMNMNRADLAVEIMPRALWILQGVCLFLGIRLTDGHFIGTDDVIPAVLGIVLVIVGLLFLAYSFYWIRHALISKDLVTDGPFGYMRHPMYVSVYIMLLGLGLLLSSWVWFAIMVAFLLVWYVDCRIEERQMIDLHGERYLDYMRWTGIVPTEDRLGGDITSLMELRNVEKIYEVGEVAVHALNDATPEVRANVYVRSSQMDHRGPFG